MHNIIEDPFLLELFKSQFPDLPVAVEQDKYNFLLSERDRLLRIIRSSPITNQENGACYVACLALDEVHKELEEMKMNGDCNL